MINKALELAAISDFKVKIGCVITDKRNRIISVGFNSKKSHPIQSYYAESINKEKIFLHAEMSALVKMRTDGHTLYVARLMKDGSAGMAKPCPICFQAITEAGITKIVYTNEYGDKEVMIL